MIFYGWYGNFWIDRIPPRRLNVAILKFSLMYRQDGQWCGFSTHAAPVGYIVHACCLSYIGIFYSIRLHSARMLPLLGIYSIRLHSARMLPLLGAACVEKPHHWRSCLYLINNVHAAASGIQLPLPLKAATSSYLFIYRLEEVAAFRKLPLSLIYLFID